MLGRIWRYKNCTVAKSNKAAGSLDWMGRYIILELLEGKTA